MFLFNNLYVSNNQSTNKCKVTLNNGKDWINYNDIIDSHTLIK